MNLIMNLWKVRGLNSNVINRQMKYCFATQLKRRGFWLWFYNLFNTVDVERLEKFGPDRSCAEWILKNGGSVRFEIQNEFIRNYNDLAPDTSELVRDHLIEIYANGVSINDHGFEHFKDCNHIERITFISCKLIGDDGLEKLHLYLKNCLKYLEIKSCPGITDRGVLSLAELSNLDKLILHNLPGISDKRRSEVTLKEVLKNTNCNLNI